MKFLLTPVAAASDSRHSYPPVYSIWNANNAKIKNCDFSFSFPMDQNETGSSLNKDSMVMETLHTSLDTFLNFSPT
jgi:hypothetical protein